MKCIGYGLTFQGSPRGIWPLPLSAAQKSLSNYTKGHAHPDWQIVPIYVGNPIGALPNPTPWQEPSMG